MAKNYLCKDCEHNNNGWCKKKSIQGLKNITDCEFKNNNIEILGKIKDIECKEYESNNLNFNDGSIIPDHTKKEEVDTGAYKVMGKREMFWNIQLQMLGIDEDSSIEDKYKALKQIMVNSEQTLLIDEKIWGIAMDYSIDEDVVEESKFISKKWKEEVGGYGE